MEAKKILSFLMTVILCITSSGTISVFAATERNIPAAIITEFSEMNFLYLKGDGTLWRYNMSKNESEKLLDDVIYTNQGSCSMEFIALQADGTLWNYNVNYQTGFTPTMSNILTATAASFQDFVRFAVTKDGKLLSWGSTEEVDEMNCMGFAEYDGSSIGKENARLILEDVKDVRASDLHAAALKNDGTLWRWGLGQETPEKISDGITEIVKVTPRVVYGLTNTNELFVWHMENGGVYFTEPSFLRNIKKFATEYEGMAYVDTSDYLWVGYRTKDFGETHFSRGMNGVKDVFIPEMTTPDGGQPVLVLKKDNTLWSTVKLNTNKEYLPDDDDFSKVMDNVSSIYVKGEKCAVITTDGYLYSAEISNRSGNFENLVKIDQVSDLEPSSWAAAEIANAINVGILYEDMQKDYKANISRLDFCKILTKTLEAKTGKSINQILEESSSQEKKQFNDTDSEYVDYMCRLGIVNGVSDKLFDPYAKITREAAAVMLTRAAKVLGHNTNGVASSDSGVSAWAAEGVGFVTQNGIMNGTGNGFEPQGNYTKEQAILTFVRLYNK